ncbi:MAG: response regulator [Nocardioidaceae bacterium]|nr:response regulator [Nocardioidaceae bacterium]
MENEAHRAQILMIEDNATDVLLTREALAEGHVLNDLEVMCRGEEALAHLYDPAVSRPDLILLDLHLPGMSGQDVLIRLKNAPDLRSIPVVVLTTSDDEADVLAAYKHHVNAYVRKPVDLTTSFISIVSQTSNFWLSIVTLPRTER